MIGEDFAIIAINTHLLGHFGSTNYLGSLTYNIHLTLLPKISSGIALRSEKMKENAPKTSNAAHSPVCVPSSRPRKRMKPL